MAYAELCKTRQYENRKPGIDRVLALLVKTPGITLPVAVATLKRWRAQDKTEDKAIALQKLIHMVGSQVALAKLLGVSQRTISMWLAYDIPHESKQPRNAVERAVVAAGGQPKMAEELGVTQQCISRWCKLGYVPVARAKEIEICYGVPRADLLSPKLRSNLGTGGDL